MPTPRKAKPTKKELPTIADLLNANADLGEDLKRNQKIMDGMGDEIIRLTGELADCKRERESVHNESLRLVMLLRTATSTNAILRQEIKRLADINTKIRRTWYRKLWDWCKSWAVSQ